MIELVIVPDDTAESVQSISLEKLRSRGFRGILLDVDNTLVPWGESQVEQDIVDWVAQAREMGFRVCLLTNNPRARGEHFARLLGIPAVYGWVKPWRWGFERGLKALGTERRETVMIGDQVFTDVLGAKSAGIHSILVPPLTVKDFLFTRVLRFFERLVGGRKG